MSDYKCIGCGGFMKYGESHTCPPASYPVPVEEAWEKLAPWKTETPAVEGVVLPERPKYSVYPGHGSGLFAMYPAHVAEDHFTLLETKLTEAIAQRDALLHYSQLCPEHLSNAYRRHMPAAEGRCASCLLTKATSKRFAAEAALATERARVLQEAADECQKRGDHLMHEEGHQESDTGAWVASDRVLDQVEGWDSAKEAVLSLIKK